MSPRAIVNLGGVLGLLLVAWLWWRSRTEQAPPGGKALHASWVAMPLLFTAAAFAWSLPFQFVSDDFNLLAQAREATAAYIFPTLTRSGDGFFRPLGHLTNWLVWRWDGANPVPFHAVSLLTHLATVAALYFLAARLYPGTRIPLWAALLFGIHGSHPETVNWMASWFGVVATFFVVVALLFLIEHIEHPSRWKLAASIACMICGLLSKESAYVFPALAVLIAGRPWRAALRRTLPFWIAALIVWCYRAAVIGGIGGYRIPGTNSAQVLHIEPAGLIKIFGQRLWSVLFFPINWSAHPEPYLIAGLAAAVIALVLLSLARPVRDRLFVSVAFIVVAALPSAHLMLIGGDLLNARGAYLATVGFALLAGVAIEGIPGRKSALCAVAALTAFQIAALEHNLLIRRDVGRLARETCEAGAAAPEQTCTVAGVPRFLNGVHFFQNGLPQCVDILSGHSRAIRIADQAGSEACVLVWDSTGRRLVRR